MYFFEEELQREISARIELMFATPDRADNTLLGACYAAFEVHSVSLECSKLYWEWQNYWPIKTV